MFEPNLKYSDQGVHEMSHSQERDGHGHRRIDENIMPEAKVVAGVPGKKNVCVINSI